VCVCEVRCSVVCVCEVGHCSEYRLSISGGSSIVYKGVHKDVRCLTYLSRFLRRSRHLTSLCTMSYLKMSYLVLRYPV